MESFCENYVFCYFKRVTAVGVSNVVARGLVCFTPLLAEKRRPLPEIIICAVLLTALILSWFLPDRKEEDLYTKKEGTGVPLNFPEEDADEKDAEDEKKKDDDNEMDEDKEM